MSTNLPLLPYHAPDDVVAWHEGMAVTATQFLHDVDTTAARLPSGGSVLNLCENRYHFLVGFGAALVTGKMTLLPPNRTSVTLEYIKDRYDSVYCLVDNNERPSGTPSITITRATVPEGHVSMPMIAADQLAAVMFTSGTTGHPQPHEKYWGSPVYLAQVTARRFGTTPDARATVLATVPPQHMFGFEASIMLPLQNGGVIHGGRPFFPEDIRAAMAACSSEPVLVTTPLHLRACVESGIRFPTPRFVLSATAALSRSLALQAEAVFGAPVLEIYGCTEAGVMATRRTVMTDLWELIDGVDIRIDGDDAVVVGEHLAASVVLGDHVAKTLDRHIRLDGRKADMVNVAGKRISLGDLNQKLLNIDGVSDGTFFVPDGLDETANRLIAFVVAPTLSREQIVAALRERIDAVFLPRPLYLVDKLPRNATGKLTKSDLRNMAQRYEKTALGNT